RAENGWRRLLCVHDWGQARWAFVGESWPTYLASQDGNDAHPDAVNRYVLSLRIHGLPVLADEFGFNKTDSDARIRGNLWASLCAGAAGAGTGTHLQALPRFLAPRRLPLPRMGPSHRPLQGGGGSRFSLAERGHHPLVSRTPRRF